MKSACAVQLCCWHALASAGPAALDALSLCPFATAPTFWAQSTWNQCGIGFAVGLRFRFESSTDPEPDSREAKPPTKASLPCMLASCSVDV